MTARQPPREKGAKACTIGLYQSRDWYFCAYFFWEFREMRCIFVIRCFFDGCYLSLSPAEQAMLLAVLNHFDKGFPVLE